MASFNSTTFRGMVVSFNLSPKGVAEGLLLRCDEADSALIIQVNFEPDLAGQVLAIIDDRAAVTIQAHPFDDAKDDAPHEVYELVRLDSGEGKSVVADGPAETDVRVRGTAVRFNYARRGEINGAILDTGDFVHLRPHGAKMARLEVGQMLDVAGEVRPGWSGHRVIEARSVNGIEIGKPPKKPHEHAPQQHKHHDHHPKPHKPKPHERREPVKH